MSLSRFLRSFAISVNAKKKITRTVNNAFGKYILLTNTISSGVLMFIGDILQQEIEYRQNMLSERYDWNRLARMTTVGFGFGPIHHYFYNGINKLWPVVNISSITKKIFADQLTMSPFCIIYFFYGVGLLESKSLPDCSAEIRSKFLHVYMVDWCVWPPAQFINFYFLPVHYQVLYINSITMLYNVFLSYVKHKGNAEKHLQKQNIA